MRENAKGRPGVDILGQTYGPGDMIAAAINSYAGPTLLVGRVTGFTEQRVHLVPEARTDSVFEDRESTISPERVVKLAVYVPVEGPTPEGGHVG